RCEVEHEPTGEKAALDLALGPIPYRDRELLEALRHNRDQEPQWKRLYALHPDERSMRRSIRTLQSGDAIHPAAPWSIDWLAQAWPGSGLNCPTHGMSRRDAGKAFRMLCPELQFGFQGADPLLSRWANLDERAWLAVAIEDWQAAYDAAVEIGDQTLAAI